MACSTKLELLNRSCNGGKYFQHGIVVRSATGGGISGATWHLDTMIVRRGPVKMLERKIASG